jgi:predicted DNA-binding protein
MTTVRLPVEIEQKLDFLSKTKHKSKTELIKEALEDLFHQEEFEKDSYELGEEYFGKYGSGDGTLSVNYKKLLKGKIRAKRNTN